MLAMDKLLSGRRILVVEDEMLVLIMIEDMLADLGCMSVTSAATVDKALALTNAQVFDAAILDINLNGHEAIQWRRSSPRAEYRLSTRPAIPITVRQTATPAGPC
jgi:CheY-like chemotaxis protein